MKNIFSALIILSGLLFFGCGSEEPKSVVETSEDTAATVSEGEINYDEMAQGFCKCMRPMIELQGKIETLRKENKEEEIKIMLDKVIRVEGEVEECILALEEKYGAVEGEEAEAKASAAVEKACPDIMKILDAAAGILEE